jgi:hypothetical protein
MTLHQELSQGRVFKKIALFSHQPLADQIAGGEMPVIEGSLSARQSSDGNLNGRIHREKF